MLVRPPLHLPSLAALGLLTASLGGCRPEGAAPDAVGLRQRFPQQAAAILDGPAAFAASGSGFAVSGEGASRGGVALTLPERGDGAFAFAAGAFRARVREVGATGAGALTGHAVAYARRGGTSYWAATEAGYEEWLLLEPSGGAGETVLTWQVEGAALAQQGDLVELRDEAGVARLRVRAPLAYDAHGAPVAVRLSTDGATLALHVAASSEAVLVDPAWTGTAAMTTGRQFHTATLLPDGEVLVAGGIDAMNPLPSSEIFSLSPAPAWTIEPQNPTWLMMISPRANHTATPLGNGQVLIAGGWGSNGEGFSVQSSADVLNFYGDGAPMFNAQGAGFLNTGRQGHTATLLPNNQVLLAGGATSPPTVPPTALPVTSAVEVYSGGMWVSAPFGMLTARDAHTATLLGNGQVLVTGGYDGANTLASAELYDPVMLTWTQVAKPMGTPRSAHTATLLPNGLVLVVGSVDEPAFTNAQATAELYDPLAGTWTPTGSMSERRGLHTATLLGNGKVLVTGGVDQTQASLKSAELYDPSTGLWTSAGSMSAARAGHTATLLVTGQVLLAGGSDGTNDLASAELFAQLDAGAACGGPGDCQSGFCVSGVCCSSACDAGECVACSVAKGAAKNGTCALLTGPACTSGNACITGATCQNGGCQGGQEKACPAPDACHDGVCDPGSGACTTPAKANGAACDDGDSCTHSDACQAGACKGVAKACTAVDACHEAGVCDPASGECSNPVKPSCDPTADAGAGAGKDAGVAPVAPSGASSCTGSGECGAGQSCADHVCCNTACTAKCFSCALPGSIGTCTAEPTGVDLRHDCGVEQNCVSTCGPGGTCLGAGKGTQCEPNRCTDDSHGLGPAYCPSEGAACPVAESVVFDCGSYRCDPAFGACYTVCRSVTECVPGSSCDTTGRCVRDPDLVSGQDVSCATPAGTGGQGGAQPWLTTLLAAGLLYARRRRGVAR